MSSRSLSAVLLLGMTLFLCAPQAMAQGREKPDTDNGRYSLSQSSDGFVRLDNRTGAISNCTNKGSGWACYSTPDEGAALDSEIGRLQAENAQLKADLAKRDKATGSLGAKIDEPLAKRDSEKSPRAPLSEAPIAKKSDTDGDAIKQQLPDDGHIDRVMAFLEKAWRRFVEMVGRVRREAFASDKI